MGTSTKSMLILNRKLPGNVALATDIVRIFLLVFYFNAEEGKQQQVVSGRSQNLVRGRQTPGRRLLFRL